MKVRLLIITLILTVILNTVANAQTLPANVNPGAVDRGVQTQFNPDVDVKAPSNNPDAQPSEDINTSQIQEATPQEQTQAPENPTPDTPKQESGSVVVNGFTVNSSEILTKGEVDAITNQYVGQNMTIDDLNKVINDINNLYVKKGYITARAFLPPQTVKDGIIEVKLVEGHIGAITVEGNRFTRRGYILKKIHQKPGDLLKLSALENDILLFNRTNSMAIRANLKPGAEFGTTDVQLVASDPNPYHVSAVFDNAGRETVGVLRGGLNFSADSLFGYRDQFTALYTRAKTTDVAYTSYSYPINNHGTRIGGNFAFSRIRISSGPFKPLNITGSSYNYSAFVSQRFINTRKVDFSGDLSTNFKQVYTYLDNYKLFTTQVRSLAIGLNFTYYDKWGRTITRNEFDQGLDILGGSAKFFKWNGQLTRVHYFGHGIIGLFRAASQLTPERLPPIEQFQLGGSGTVRGYSEGLLIGDQGYFFSGELRTPIPFLPKKIGKLPVRDRISALIFCDHGGVFNHRAQNITHYNFLTSVGLGLRAQLTKYIDGRLDYGFGLGQRETPQPCARLHFGIEARPF